MNPHQKYYYENLAKKHRGFAFLLGVSLSPLGYVYVEEWHWAIINLFTLNYFFLGFFLVPIHAVSFIDEARLQLEEQ